uniref:Uncharacterized protein n=1 Tax=Arundo donax TaxID=35708 RepID=A0A0A9BQD8_ARUDO
MFPHVTMHFFDAAFQFLLTSLGSTRKTFFLSYAKLHIFRFSTIDATLFP